MVENVGETPHIGVRGSRIIDDDARQTLVWRLMFGVIELFYTNPHQAISSEKFIKPREQNTA